jgi:hypothetical protein
MEKVILTIREADNFIVPNTDNEIQRRKELRARTLLAYGYDQGIFKPFVDPIDHTMSLVVLDRVGNVEGRSVTGDEMRFAMQHDLFTGCIEIADSITAGWSDQPCKLMLLVKHGTNVDLLLRHYFQTPLRWLNDQSHTKYAISAAVESLQNG